MNPELVAGKGKLSQLHKGVKDESMYRACLTDEEMEKQRSDLEVCVERGKEVRLQVTTVALGLIRSDAAAPFSDGSQYIHTPAPGTLVNQ